MMFHSISRTNARKIQAGDAIIEWLKEASLSTSAEVIVTNISKIQEYLLNKSPQLLIVYLEETLQFANNVVSTEVRCRIAEFIEAVGDKEPEHITKMFETLLQLLSDDSPIVTKRAMRASGRILRAATVNIPSDIETISQQMNTLKAKIIDMIDSDNEGIRTQAIKFIECVVLMQTSVKSTTISNNDDTLENASRILKKSRQQLEDEAEYAMKLLIKFHGSLHISSANLMICMGSLSSIAKVRPQFMTMVVQALQKLQNNLPPTLTASQINSVRKQLRLALTGLLKHPAGVNELSLIIEQLKKLGVSEQDILKINPESIEIRRVIKRHREMNAINAKRMKLAADKSTELIELSESMIAERLSVEVAAELVIDNIHRLPKTITASFQREYQPIDTPDLDVQRRAIANCLVMQIHQSKTVNQPIVNRHTSQHQVQSMEIDNVIQAENNSIKKPAKVVDKRARIREQILKLTEITKPLTPEIQKKIILSVVTRILRAEKNSALGGNAAVRAKVLAIIATYNPFVKKALMQYIKADISARLDFALLWLHEEYALLKDSERQILVVNPPAANDSYNFLLSTLISTIELLEGKFHDTLITKLYLEAPMITDDAIRALKSYTRCRINAGLTLMKKLVMRRSKNQLIYVIILLNYCVHDLSSLRNKAIAVIGKIYHHRTDLRRNIDEYTVGCLEILLCPSMPEILCGEEYGRPDVHTEWNELDVSAYLELHLALMHKKPELMRELARVYISMTVKMKKIVLKLTKKLFKALSISKLELLTLERSCPKGAEKLVSEMMKICHRRNKSNTD